MLIMNLTYYFIKILGFLMFFSLLFYPPKSGKILKRLLVFLSIYILLNLSHYLYFNPTINNDIPVFVYDQRKETGDTGAFDDYYHLDNNCPEIMKGERYNLILSGEARKVHDFSECPTCYSIFLDKNIN